MSVVTVELTDPNRRAIPSHSWESDSQRCSGLLKARGLGNGEEPSGSDAYSCAIPRHLPDLENVTIWGRRQAPLLGNTLDRTQ